MDLFGRGRLSPTPKKRRINRVEEMPSLVAGLLGALAAPFVTPYRLHEPRLPRQQTKMGIIPPPPPERLREGEIRKGEILKELPNTLGLVLWQEIRHLRDWAESASEVRSGLFPPPTLEVQARWRETRETAAELRRAFDHSLR